MCNRGGGDSMRRLLTVPKICVENVNDEPMDKYTAGIELSNACRQFYVSRVKAAGKIKERLELADTGINYHTDSSSRGSNQNVDTLSSEDDGVMINGLGESAQTPSDQKVTNTGKSRIEKAMDVLKNEMASLIDQDLALMKQLLTLNEQIEELKWQRKLRGYQVEGSGASSCNIDSRVSVCTLSDGEWDSRLDHREYPGKYPTPSSLSLYSDYGTSPRASVDRELSRPGGGGVGGSGPGPSKLVQDNTHKLIERESTSDLGSSDELTSSTSELPDSNSGTRSRDSGEPYSFDSGFRDSHKDHRVQCVTIKTLELTL